MRFKDISTHEKTLVKKINDELITKINSMNYDEIKKSFLSCLNNSDVFISKETKNKYVVELENKKSLLQLQKWIYNISLKGSGLGTF